MKIWIILLAEKIKQKNMRIKKQRREFNFSPLFFEDILSAKQKESFLVSFLFIMNNSPSALNFLGAF